jgi:hypothetical protein
MTLSRKPRLTTSSTFWSSFFILTLCCAETARAEIALPDKWSFINAIPTVITSILFGGLAGALFTTIYQKKRSKNIYRSLLTVYSVEFVNAFERCITYYKQIYSNNEISYSAIFEFSDESFLARFAEVCENISLIKAVVNLKLDYFQIVRHVEQISHFVIESEGLQPDEDISYRAKARQAEIHRRAAIGFFQSSYDRILESTEAILEATHKANKDISTLVSNFDDLKKEKSEIDKKLQSS